VDSANLTYLPFLTHSVPTAVKSKLGDKQFYTKQEHRTSQPSEGTFRHLTITNDNSGITLEGYNGQNQRMKLESSGMIRYTVSDVSKRPTQHRAASIQQHGCDVFESPTLTQVLLSVLRLTTSKNGSLSCMITNLEQASTVTSHCGRSKAKGYS